MKVKSHKTTYTKDIIKKIEQSLQQLYSFKIKFYRLTNHKTTFF